MQAFRLNMKILNDALSAKYAHVTLFSDSDDACLETVRPYSEGQPLKKQFVYTMTAAELRFLPSALEGFSFIVSGSADPTGLPAACSVLIVEDAASLPELFTLIQDTFEFYAR